MFAIGIYCAITGAFGFGAAVGWYSGRWHAEQLGDWRPSIVPVRDRDLVALAPIFDLPIARSPRGLPTSPHQLLFDQDGTS